MYKWILGLVALYLVGDPSLEYVGNIGETGDYLLALVSAYLVMPMVTSELEG